MNFQDFTPEQLDVIREIGNIGSGNAATAMAQFLNTPIKMNVPRISVRPFEEVAAHVGAPDKKVVTLQFGILGEIKGYIVFVVDVPAGKEMVRLLIPDSDPKGPFSEMEVSCLMEVGNILASAFIISLSHLTKKYMVVSIPRFSLDMLGAIFSQAVSSVSVDSDDTLVFETNLIKDDNKNLKMHLFLLASPDTILQLLKSVGMDKKGGK